MSRSRIAALPAIAVAALALLSGCGSSGGTSAEPAVCTDVDAIQATVTSMKDVQIGQGAVPQIKTDLVQLQGQLQTLKTNAQDQYATQIDGVTTALTTLQSAVQAVESSPSATALGTLTTAVGTTVTAVQTLTTAVSDTCK